MGKTELNYEKYHDKVMESIEKLSASINSRPAIPEWKILASEIDRVSKIVAGTEAKMKALMQEGQHDKMLELWNNTVGYRQDRFYAEIESKYNDLSDSDKAEIQQKYDEYTELREDFEDTCRLYENRMKGMRREGKRTSLIGGPIFTVIMVVIIKVVGWDNWFTHFFALVALVGTVEAVCGLISDKLHANGILHWGVSIFGSALGAFVWMLLLGMPHITFWIGVGLFIWAYVAYDIGSGTFTMVS